MSFEILSGDALDLAHAQGDATVDCLVTSPPYWGLRDYGCDGQLGLEPHPSLYLEALWAHAEEWWRLLKPTGCLFVNLGDTYGGSGCGANDHRTGSTKQPTHLYAGQGSGRTQQRDAWLRPKQLLLIPSRFAIGMQERGWLLRNDVVWSKPNAMPSSVQDRFSCTYEHVFLFSKQGRYWFALDDVREPFTYPKRVYNQGDNQKCASIDNRNMRGLHDGREKYGNPEAGKNPGDTWRMCTVPFPEAHFATFPPDLPRRCIRAGCPPRVCAECGKPWVREVEIGKAQDHPLRENRSAAAVQFSAGDNAYKPGGNLGKVRERTPGPWHPSCACNAGDRPGLVLDPFCGSGTTGMVAVQEGRNFLGFELSADYIAIARRRLAGAQEPLLTV